MYAGVLIKISLSASSIARLFIYLFNALEFPRLVHLIQKYRWQYFHYLDIILLILIWNTSYASPLTLTQRSFKYIFLKNRIQKRHNSSVTIQKVPFCSMAFHKASFLWLLFLSFSSCFDETLVCLWTPSLKTMHHESLLMNSTKIEQNPDPCRYKRRNRLSDNQTKTNFGPKFFLALDLYRDHYNELVP